MAEGFTMPTRMRNWRNGAARGSLAMALVASSPVWAQATTADATTASEAAADEIIVTARRRAESITEVPVAVTAFPEQALEDRNIESTFDLIKVAPGLNINFSGAGLIFVTIRGQTRATAGLGTPGVVSYFNEVPLPTIGSAIPVFDLENIQVLKGPQGTLFGRNAIGGAILNYSRTPDYALGGYAEAEYGRFDQRKLEGALNIPIVANALALRVAGQYSASDGYQKTAAYTAYTQDAFGVSTPGTLIPGARRYDANRVEAVRASLLFEPTAAVRNVTVFDHTRFRGAPNNTAAEFFPQGVNGGPPAPYFVPSAFLIPGFTAAFGSAPAGTLAANNIGRLFQCGTAPNCDIFVQANAQGADRRRSFTDLPTRALVKTLGLSNTTTVDLSDDVRLKNIFGYRRSRWDQNQDLDGTALPILDTTGFSQLEQTTEELQLSGDLFDDRLSYVFGGFYYETNPTGAQGAETLGINIFGGLQNSTATTYKHERSEALYGQLDYSLAALLEGLSVTAGYRYTWDRSFGCAYTVNYTPFGGERPGRNDFKATERQCVTNSFPAFPTPIPITSGNFREKSSKGTYTFALNWKPADDTLLYATTRRGYRSGSFNGTIVDPALAALRTYDPETLTDYEVGLKTRWSAGGMRGTFEGAAYTGKDKAYQYYQSSANVPPLPNGGLIINKADLRIKGFDLAATLSPVEGLTIGGGVAYTDIKILRLTLPPLVASSFAAIGRDPTATVTAGQPKWQTTANIGYELPEPVLGGQLKFNADFHYQSRFLQGNSSIPGYETVDARISLDEAFGSPVDIFFNVRNLFDSYYYDSGANTTPDLGVLSYHVAPPRTWSLGLRYRFGS